MKAVVVIPVAALHRLRWLELSLKLAVTTHARIVKVERSIRNVAGCNFMSVIVKSIESAKFY